MKRQLEVSALRWCKAHSASACSCSQSQIQEVLAATGSWHDHSGEVKVHSGTGLYWLYLRLKSGPKPWAFIAVSWLPLGMDPGCPDVWCVRLFSLSCPQRSHQSDCPQMERWSDVVGTPSLTYFCHNNVWMCVCCICVSVWLHSVVDHLFPLNIPHYSWIFLIYMNPVVRPGIETLSTTIPTADYWHDIQWHILWIWALVGPSFDGFWNQIWKSRRDFPSVPDSFQKPVE